MVSIVAGKSGRHDPASAREAGVRVPLEPEPRPHCDDRSRDVSRDPSRTALQVLCANRKSHGNLVIGRKESVRTHLKTKPTEARRVNTSPSHVRALPIGNSSSNNPTIH